MLKNITLSADEQLIQKARERARREHTTLNETFRSWLKQYVNTASVSRDYDAIMRSFNYVNPGRAFTRDEMNER